MSHQTMGTIGTLMLETIIVLPYVTAFQYFSAPHLGDGAFTMLTPYNFAWLPSTETLRLDLGILFDPISVMMLIVVSTMSLMVYIYSFGYMKGETGLQRYYAFPSLFTVSVLGLVVATNVFQMYPFRELVSISSYLLIGFYCTKPAAIAISRKMFIIIRFADLGSPIGILIYGHYGGTFDFTSGTVSLISDDASMPPLALGLMFIGDAGKSAIFPLCTWLPDVMEGPTPVSTLIHATAVIVAGVYLAARIFPLFIAYAPGTLHMIAWVGAFTAFYVANVAYVQSDIRHVLAFPTISQIGLMMITSGACISMDPHHKRLGYIASMFHFLIHATFKTLFFLGTGNTIHAVHSNEMSAIGGLHKYMPITHQTFLIACFVIVSVSPSSGFFSENEILAACFQYSPAMGWVMVMIVTMTVFYMFRLYYGISQGAESPRTNSYSDHSIPYGDLETAPYRLHESPLAVTSPLIFLAVVVYLAGFIPFGHFISSNRESYSIHLDLSVAVTSVVIAIIPIGTTAWMYKGIKQSVADAFTRQFNGLRTAAYHRSYTDDICQFVAHKIIFYCISTPTARFDRRVVSGFFNFLAWATNTTSDEVRGLQSGQAQRHVYIFPCGALALILLLVLQQVLTIRYQALGCTTSRCELILRT